MQDKTQKKPGLYSENKELCHHQAD